MPATLSSPIEATAAEAGALTKIQKLAALLVMLGADSAAQILKQFSPREIEAISREIARFNLITLEQQREILGDFSDVAIAASTSLSAGPEVARNALEKALGTFKAGDILARIFPSRPPVAAMQTITDLDARQIFSLIREERTQTIAFIISYLSAEKAAQVFALVRPEQRDQIIERLATLAPTPVEVVERVVDVLNARLGIKQTRVYAQTGGVTTAADLLNAMEKTTSRSVLAGIEGHNPGLSQAIRKKMFTFEDLRLLERSAVQRVLRETDTHDLALALKQASAALTKFLLTNISRRSADAVRDEMSILGHVKLRDVEAAQLRIIDVVRKLETEGEIELDDAEATTAHEIV